MVLRLFLLPHDTKESPRQDLQFGTPYTRTSGGLVSGLKYVERECAGKLRTQTASWGIAVLKRVKLQPWPKQERVQPCHPTSSHPVPFWTSRLNFLRRSLGTLKPSLSIPGAPGPLRVCRALSPPVSLPGSPLPSVPKTRGVEVRVQG